MFGILVGILVGMVGLTIYVVTKMDSFKQNVETGEKPNVVLKLVLELWALGMFTCAILSVCGGLLSGI